MLLPSKPSWRTVLLLGGLSLQPLGVTCAPASEIQGIEAPGANDLLGHHLAPIEHVGGSVVSRAEGSMVSRTADTTNVYVFLVRKAGTTMEEFKAYYESHHVPLIERLVFDDVQPLSYRRNYVNRTNTASVIGGFGPNWVHDCITTVVCRDKTQRDALLKKFAEQNPAIAKDEANFLDRSKSLMILPSESLDTVPRS